jgi:uncharacterized membrane protein YdjX (TVP38/TMEM64 family)
MSATRTPDRRHEAAEELPVEAEPAVERAQLGRFEYALLGVLVVMAAGTGVGYFVFDVNLDTLDAYGYAGLFVISLISAASIVMPMPGAAAITSAGALLDPVLGIPVPVLVGLVAGPAEALGELTGYAAGYGGSGLFRDRPSYPRVQRWMERRGIITMFLLSSFPNPLVDVAGVAAGAVKMELPRFFVGVLGGKIVKNIYLASGGLAAGELIRRLIG